MEQLLSLFGFRVWVTYLTHAVQGLLLAVPVALLFELGGWLTRNWVLKRMQPAFSRSGAQRDAVERARRRRALRDLTVSGLRWLQNILAVLVIFGMWGINLVVVAMLVIALVAVAWMPLRDLLAGYMILLDDCLAPGDQVVLNHKLAGTVSECGPRRVKLDDGAGRLLLMPWSEVKVVESRAPAPPVDGGGS